MEQADCDQDGVVDYNEMVIYTLGLVDKYQTALDSTSLVNSLK